MRLVLAAALTAMLVSSAAAEDCKPLQRYGKIPFEATDKDDPHIYLPVTMAGFKTFMMLDTGAYWSLTRAELAKHLNLQIRTNYNIIMSDASGNKIDKSVIVPEFTLGQLKFGAAEFFVSNIFEGEALDKIAGVVGQNLFTQVDLEVDNAGRAISLFSQDHCPGEGVYWADEAVILKYDRENAKATKSASRIRRQVDKNQIDEPIVAAELQGKPITLLFDTGATFTSIDLEVAERLFGIKPTSPGVESSGKVMTATGATTEVYKYTFKELVISGIRFENVPVRLGNFGNSAQVILGMNEMKHLRMFFAFKEGVIYVTAANAGTGK